MFQDIIKATGLDKADIELQVKEQHDRGEAAFSNIGQEINSDFKLYRSAKLAKAKEKIGDFTVFSTTSALMALSYMNRPESEFATTEIGQSDAIANLNNTYKTDFDTDDMEILSYQEDFFKFLT